MFARAVKTAPELQLLERATRLNEAAITHTVAAWDEGATWRDLNHVYARAVIDLGGFRTRSGRHGLGSSARHGSGLYSFKRVLLGPTSALRPHPKAPAWGVCAPRPRPRATRGRGCSRPPAALGPGTGR